MRSAILFSLAIGLLLRPTNAASDPAPANPVCHDAVQGRIVWDDHGNTAWSPANIDRLCRGVQTDEPARCFDRVMHGGISWGGGTRWQWQNAIDLCEGTSRAEATISCFTSRISQGQGWQASIATCGVSEPDSNDHPPVQVGEQGGHLVVSIPDPNNRPAVQLPDPAETLTIGAVVPSASMDPLPLSRNRECQDALQGRIAWDNHGSTTWSAANVDRLCRGAGSSQPARCFDRVMHGGISWGGGTQWQWDNAVDLCEGTPDAAATVSCFEQKVAAGQDWRAAISACDERSDRRQRLNPTAAR